MRTNEYVRLAAAVLICEIAGLFGAIFTARAVPGWYEILLKPPFSPSGMVLWLAWLVLYALMGVALYMVWKNAWKVKNRILVPKKGAWNKLSERLWVGDWQKQNIIGIFAFQWILNVLWPYLFFGLFQTGWAFFELAALWYAILYAIVNFYRVSKTAAWLLIPCLIWVTFVAYLNYFIWIMN